MKAQILSIDAWRNEFGGWDWNQWFNVAESVEIPDGVTNRQLLKLARDEFGLLSDESKGRVAVEDDGNNLVILEKNTREPIFAFDYGRYLL